MIFVQKNDGTRRSCIEFRQLNKVIVKKKYPLPRIDDLYYQLKGERIFSNFDLRLSFHKVRIWEEYTNKMEFWRSYDHYEFVVVSSELKNAWGIFMCLMNGVFNDYLEKKIIVFLDDIHIYSKIEEEHEKNLRMVLHVLRDHQLYAKFSKCTFYQR